MDYYVVVFWQRTYYRILTNQHIEEEKWEQRRRNGND